MGYPNYKRTYVSQDRFGDYNENHERTKLIGYPKYIKVNFAENEGEIKLGSTTVQYKAWMIVDKGVDIKEDDVISELYVVKRIINQVSISGKIKQKLVYLE